MPDVFLDTMPDTPNTCVGLFEYAGEPPTQYFGGRSCTYNVRARARANLRDEAFSLAQQVEQKLDYFDETVSIRQISAVLGTGQDSSGRYEYTANYAVTIKE